MRKLHCYLEMQAQHFHKLEISMMCLVTGEYECVDGTESVPSLSLIQLSTCY